MLAFSKLRFLTAKDARKQARNNIVVFNEIRDLEQAILIEVAAGQYSVIIDNTTFMTTTSEYYQVWMGLVESDVISSQMNDVIDYFVDLGYSIARLENDEKTLFKWKIMW